MWSELAQYAAKWGLGVWELALWLFQHPGIGLAAVAEMIANVFHPFHWDHQNGVLVLTNGRLIL